LFTKVVAVAERQGRPVKLVIIPTSDAYSAIAQTAFRLNSSEVAMGESAKVSAELQAHLVGEAWDKIPGTRARQVRLRVYTAGGEHRTFPLGVHVPEFRQSDLDLIHELWLDAYTTIGAQVHHRDIVTAALREYANDLRSDRRGDVLKKLKNDADESGSSGTTLQINRNRAG